MVSTVHTKNQLKTVTLPLMTRIQTMQVRRKELKNVQFIKLMTTYAL